MSNLTIALQALVATSIFFVWVVRYANIVDEFAQYGLPNWLRDLVGILKMTFALFLLIGIDRGWFAVLGGIGIAVLMGAAVPSPKSRPRCAGVSCVRRPGVDCSSAKTLRPWALGSTPGTCSSGVTRCAHEPALRLRFRWMATCASKRTTARLWSACCAIAPGR